ncbi:S8 family serine peptidase [Desulfovibrio sulfodismutans]|uniref:S8 family serine peptidase n=1 Tax=Desulfolutivibrio sulfodismutans TaxID=63561 RepID=A0A7K3NPW9_9BACT|nr:S8 family serine peptidase [Desulfolutivibrio sulfodismutans]NDY57249.1 S8 family serine peptidase [Desulfolutivibrio sulfodismutans]
MRVHSPRRFCLVLSVVVFLLSVSLSSGVGRAAETDAGILASVGANAKLVSSGNALAAFKNGQETARFIVMLAEPATTKKGVALDSEAGKSARRSEVAAVLDGFLNRKKAADTGDVTRRFDYMPAFAATLTAAQLQGLLADDAVAFVRQDRMNKPQLRQGIPLMGASATRSEYSGQGVAVAIVDTGVDYMNTYLGAAPLASNAKVIGGYDTGEGKADPMDTDGHGTACAGIVAGTVGDTGDYIGGVAPDAKIYALKITDASGQGPDSAIIAAWEWCITHQNDNADNPILIINTSFGGERYTSNCDGTLPDYVTVVQNVTNAGITIFASSGNEGYCDAMGSPACLSGVLSVGAVYDANVGTQSPCVEAECCLTKHANPDDPNCPYNIEESSAADQVTGYSDTASFLTLFAPSTQCYTLQCSAKGSTFNTDFGGTSAASPYAAGAAAALQNSAKEERGAFLSPAQVKSLLVGTGKLITDTKAAVTKPRVNLQAAIGRMLGAGVVAPQSLLLQDE